MRAYYAVLLVLLSGCLGGGGGSETDLTPVATSGIQVTASQTLLAAAASTTVSVRVYGENNPAPLPSQPFSVHVSGGALVSDLPTHTDNNGEAVFRVSHPGSENVTLTVTSGSFSQSLNLYFGASVQVNISDNFQRADGVALSTVSVVARDAHNVPLSNIPVSLRGTSNQAFFSAYQGVTASNGLFSATIRSSAAETFTVYADAGGMSSAPAQVTFVTAAAALTVSTTTPVLARDNSAELRVQIQRDNGGRSDALPDAPFSVAVSGAAQLHNVPPRTDANGLAVFQVSNPLAENVTLTVTSGTLSQTLKLYFGASLTLLPLSSNAAGSAILTALLKDANGAPLPAQNLSFGFIGVNNKTLSPVSAETDSQGTLALTVTDIANSGGLTVVEARSGGLSAQATINFLSTLGSGQTVAVEPALALSAVNQGVNLSATLSGNQGVPVSGVAVTFRVNGNATFGGGREFSAVSDNQGKVYATLYNSSAENVLVSVHVGTVTQTVPVYFGASLKFQPNLTSGSLDAPVTLNAVVSDGKNIALSGVPVFFRATGGNALLDTFQSVSNSIGVSTVNVSNHVSESTIIEASVSGLPPVTAQIDFTPGKTEATLLRLSTEPAQALISLNGQATVRASLSDAANRPVADGTRVEFRVAPLGSIEAVAFTHNGQASVTFYAGTQAGDTTVTASSAGLSASAPLTIIPGADIGSLEIYSINPDVIGISGSGTVQNALIRVLLKDALGNPMGVGVPVTFRLSDTRLHGGEILASGTASGTEINAFSNADGIAEVSLRSGSVAGTIDVIAQAGIISTVARVAIVGGAPDARHFSLAAQQLNLAGGIQYGLTTTITAYVGDRYGNIVADGTRVSFISEGGLIGESQSTGAFTTTTTLGRASAILQTAAPTVPNLGGVAPVGNPGYNKIVAYTTGSEHFIDRNGNGIYDLGEPFDDLSEPYIDANDSGAFELGELYVDVNNDGNFNPGNGRYDGNTVIWTAMTILFSGRATPQSLVLQPATFNTCAAGVQSFSAIIQDQWGNALAPNSSATVTATAGTLKGNTSVNLSDSFVAHVLSFELVNDPIPNCDYQPIPQSARITLNVTMMDGAQTSKSVSGTVCTYSCQ
jgi:adhesin/invasin